MPAPASSYRSQGGAGSRVVSALLSVAIAAGIIALLILAGLMPEVFVPFGTKSLSTFEVSAGQEAAQATKSDQPEPQQRSAARPKAAAAPPRTAPPPPPVPSQPTPVPEAPTLPGVIQLSPSEFAATDIGRIRGTAPARDGAGSGSASASTGGSRQVAGPGGGPGGKTLYAADWYREPSRAEVAPYMPAGVSEGWGMIACRTVERYHVEDCRVIGETPGSRIGQGLRQAAWQFLVIPPREDGRPMLGVWVRIRFDLVRGVER
jgi:hypothetical protein